MATHHLDVRRMLCPMPVIKTQNKITELSAGDELSVVCTDPGVKSDIPAWCRIHGHQISEIREKEYEITILIVVGTGSD